MIKAISLWEPWATLMALGEKKCETRGWSANYRGWLAIHATKNMPAESRSMIRHTAGILNRYFIGMAQLKATAGCVLAIVWLDDILPTNDHFFPLSTSERAFGDYSPDRYIWQTSHLYRLPEPIPARGRQRLWNWEVPEGVAAALAKGLP